MFQRLDYRRKRLRSEGFTLIEVVVALGILSLVAGVVVGQVIVGLRATAASRDVSQAKGVAQGRLEAMRNLPFHVGRAAGEYIDVLDTYYRNLTAPSSSANCSASAGYPTTLTTGFVSASAPRCSYEPATGAFYRHVTNPVATNGLGDFALVVDTQFLSASTPPTAITPPGTYNSQSAGRDFPAAQQIGVTATVFYKAQSGTKSVSTYTQIDNQAPVAPSLTSSVTVSTVRVASTTSSSALTAVLGAINLNGEVYTGSRVGASATSGAASNSSGQQITAAAQNLSAPTDTAATSVSQGAAAMPGGCGEACFGLTTVDGTALSASNGLPLAGLPFTPVRAVVAPSLLSVAGFEFANDANHPLLGLSSSAPMVTFDSSTIPASARPQNCAFTGATQSNYVYATAYLNSTKAATSSATACGTTQTGTVELFPTAFAPNGVVRITVRRAAAACQVVTSATGTKLPTATGTYNVLVEYWTGNSYASQLVTDTNTTDPLRGVDLTAPIGRVNGGSNVSLGDYVSSWKSLVRSQIVTTASGPKAEVDMKPLVSIDTGQTRIGDPTSVLSLQVGALACKVGDSR